MLKLTSFILYLVLVCTVSTAQAAPRNKMATKVHPEFNGGFCRDEITWKEGLNMNDIQGPFLCLVKDKYSGIEEVAAFFETVPDIYLKGFRIVLIYNNEAMVGGEKKKWVSILVERK